MKYQHPKLAAGSWYSLAFYEQMANIGSEVERAILWKNKNKTYCIKAMERALELLSLTIDDKKNRCHLKELTRLYEALVDYFYYDNQFASSDKLWRNYFFGFAYVTRLQRSGDSG